MPWPLSYREAQFTPAEVTDCTGLSQSLQRNWRSQGFLPTRTTGQKRFSPRELAEIRVMVTLRHLGLALPESRAAAEEAASSVLFIALMNHGRDSVEIEAEGVRAERYRKALRWETDDSIQRAISGAADERPLYLRLQGGRCLPLLELGESANDHTVESFALVDLEAVAAALVSAAPRPLFTLIVPRNFP